MGKFSKRKERLVISRKSGSGFLTEVNPSSFRLLITAIDHLPTAVYLILGLCNENSFFSLEITVLHLMVVKEQPIVSRKLFTHTQLSVIITEQSQINQFYYFLISSNL